MMGTLRRFYGFALVLFVFSLSACGGSSHPKNTPVPLTTTPSTVLPDLRQKYEALGKSQQAIAQVWENLATGQQARCGEYPEVINPATVSAGGDTALEPLAELLHRAAVDIDQAVSLWKGECLKPRANPSPDVINQGRLAARAAGDALKQAGELLANFPK